MRADGTLTINSILYEITWNPLQTVITAAGVGHGGDAIAVARYILAIANGGTVYQSTIIKRRGRDGTVIQGRPKVAQHAGRSERLSRSDPRSACAR